MRKKKVNVDRIDVIFKHSSLGGGMDILVYGPVGTSKPEINYVVDVPGYHAEAWDTPEDQR
jgi:hypothetical protein